MPDKLTDNLANNSPILASELSDSEIIKAWDILAKLDFFGGQRAGRELWNEKPVDVQNEDIKNFSKDIAFLKDLINRLQGENEKNENIIKVADKTIVTLNAENESLKAEVEKQKDNYMELLETSSTRADIISKQKAEIERLQNTLDDVLDRQPTLVERSENMPKPKHTRSLPRG